MRGIELTLGTVVILAIPGTLSALFAVRIMLTGYDDPALRIGLIASDSGIMAETMVLKPWGGEMIEAGGDPIPHHDERMREGGS